VKTLFPLLIQVDIIASSVQGTNKGLFVCTSHFDLNHKNYSEAQSPGRISSNLIELKQNKKIKAFYKTVFYILKLNRNIRTINRRIQGQENNFTSFEHL